MNKLNDILNNTNSGCKIVLIFENSQLRTIARFNNNIAFPRLAVADLLCGGRATTHQQRTL